MRGLVALVIGMGVFLVLGSGAVAYKLVAGPGRPIAAPAADLLLHQPPGTRITGIAAAGPALAILLQGGGPDRIEIIDPATARKISELSLAH